jgi:release factor glutamine methyltransferase
MTIRAALNFGINELTKAHTHDPEGCAKFLLRHALELALSNKHQALSLETQLLVKPNLMLNTECLSLFKEMLDRRVRHEPVWYITNEAYFWRDTFYVDGRVLIPRPETELVVEKALEWMYPQLATRQSQLAQQSLRGELPVPSRESRFSIFDVGTGAGVIAISLARELLEALETHESSDSSERSDRAPFTIYASDISSDAIEVAKLNARRIGVEQLMRFHAGDALDPLPHSVDLVIGNPPYIRSDEIGSLAYDIHHFEPRIALDGGRDGLDVHRKILALAPKKLKKSGAIFLEIGYDQGEMASTIARCCFPRSDVSVKKDDEGNDRIILVKT